jgi:hypothetical protein
MTLENGVAIQKVGAGQSHSAEFPAKDAKRQVTVTRHRGKQKRCFKRNVADSDHWRKERILWAVRVGDWQLIRHWSFLDNPKPVAHRIV